MHPPNGMIAATLAASIYLLLTIAAFLSTVSPELTSLSSHGKTRTSCREECRNRSYVATDGMLRRLWQCFISSPKFAMHKRRFIDFYAAGVIVTSILLLGHYTTIASDPYAALIGRRDTYFQTNNHNYNWMPTCLLLTHLIRRYCECKWVQKSGSSSQMHVAGYLLGILHYLCLPFILVPYPYCFFWTCANHDEKDNQYPGACSDGIHNTSIKKLVDTIAIIGCIYFQYEQHRHHIILARLRSKEPASAIYPIPVGGWFKYVSCPHYFSEIMIYFMFALLMHDGSNTLVKGDVKACPNYLLDLLPNTISNATLMTIYRAKHWILWIWVVVNLSVSASSTDDWYRKNFGATYPQQRKRLIPFMW